MYVKVLTERWQNEIIAMIFEEKSRKKEEIIMSTKAYYPINEFGAGKVGFSRTGSIIECAFYGNNVVKVNTLNEANELA